MVKSYNVLSFNFSIDKNEKVKEIILVMNYFFFIEDKIMKWFGYCFIDIKSGGIIKKKYKCYEDFFLIVFKK